jgi:hypothetical protein
MEKFNQQAEGRKVQRPSLSWPNRLKSERDVSTNILAGAGWGEAEGGKSYLNVLMRNCLNRYIHVGTWRGGGCSLVYFKVHQGFKTIWKNRIYLKLRTRFQLQDVTSRNGGRCEKLSNHQTPSCIR